MFRDILANEINGRWPGHVWMLQTPPDPELGDYTVNLAFSLAKTERRAVLEIAKEVGAFITTNDALADMVQRADVVAPGFVNIFLKDHYLQDEMERIHGLGDIHGNSQEGRGKKVIVEYSSINIAKPMHVGHLRSTVIGDALANVYSFLGYDVIRWNYLGDWGTQFGKLIAAYKKWGSEELLKDEPVEALVKLYVRFNKEAVDDPALEQEGREEFKKLEAGDGENRKLWERFRALSLRDAHNMYERLRVALNDEAVVNKGESDYEEALGPLIETLMREGIAVQGEGGALVVNLQEQGIVTPGLIRKSDGATLYLTRDIASVIDRLNTYQPDSILYVVANQQALHFEQLFAVIEMMRQKNVVRGTLPKLTHIKYGLVLGEDGKKFSTREGNVVSLAHVLDEAESRAEKVVREKNTELSGGQARDISHQVAVGALKYNDLRQHPHSDITFDWDAMLDLTGNSGPYLQYTYARLNRILDKAGDFGAGDRAGLEHEDERLLMRKLLDFSFAVSDVVRAKALNGLALYLFELSSLANRYYEKVRILEDQEMARKEARLTLVETVAGTLRTGLRLLGIDAPERV